MTKVFNILQEELYGLHLRWLLVRILLFPLPPFVGSRLRVKVLNLFGFHIGAGSSMWGLPKLIGSGKLHQKLIVGQHSLFNVDCFLDLAGPITIGNQVILGPQVMLTTGAHKIGEATTRAGELSPRPIVVEDGAWLGARCTVLPGVTIGRGAVVAAGAVVNKDVACNTLVGGVPAKVIRHLDEGHDKYQPASELEAIV
jgi:acetyltransferase-like isoleucine patch superfamily enzyme